MRQFSIGMKVKFIGPHTKYSERDELIVNEIYTVKDLQFVDGYPTIYLENLNNIRFTYTHNEKYFISIKQEFYNEVLK